MPALIKQTTKLLGHPSTMLDFASVHLYQIGTKKPLTPSEWVNKHVGKTKADAKDGTARCEDGLITAAGIRPPASGPRRLSPGQVERRQ